MEHGELEIAHLLCFVVETAITFNQYDAMPVYSAKKRKKRNASDIAFIEHITNATTTYGRLNVIVHISQYKQ